MVDHGLEDVGRALRIAEQHQTRRAGAEVHGHDRVADQARVAGRAGQGVDGDGPVLVAELGPRERRPIRAAAATWRSSRSRCRGSARRRDGGWTRRARPAGRSLPARSRGASARPRTGGDRELRRRGPAARRSRSRESARGHPAPRPAPQARERAAACRSCRAAAGRSRRPRARRSRPPGAPSRSGDGRRGRCERGASEADRQAARPARQQASSCRQGRRRSRGPRSASAPALRHDACAGRSGQAMTLLAGRYMNPWHRSRIGHSVVVVQTGKVSGLASDPPIVLWGSDMHRTGTRAVDYP